MKTLIWRTEKIVVVGAGVTAMVAAAATGCVPRTVQQCSPHWEPAQVLETADGRPAYVEAPVAIREGKGLLLLGTPTFVWTRADTFDPPPGPKPADTAAYFARFQANFGGVGLTLDPGRVAMPVEPPPGAHAGLMRKLSAVQGADGTIHVVWFSPAHGSTNPDSANGDVWYAERRGDKWSSPVRIYSADRVDGIGEKAALLMGSNSDIHLVVHFVRGEIGGLAYIRRADGVWAAREHPLGGLPSEPAIQLIGADSLAIAFQRVGTPRVPGAHTIPGLVRVGQHVFFVRAAVSDTVWPAAKIVRFSDLGMAQRLAMYRLPAAQHARTITLVWDRFSTDPEQSDSVFALVSEDGGESWQPPEALSLPFRVGALSQAVDSRGDVHIAVTPFNGVMGSESSYIYHSVLKDGKWSALDSIADTVASVPKLSSIGSDAMFLAWGNPRPTDSRLGRTIAPVTKFTTLNSACASGN